ncbi:hypothetical protein HHI36_018870 [Cryptolaemus montrouzieri]|uniref:Uncharacterized protein n=1 Tax=Cryptolaemus montrouzieri TaxID=559131 RepID=A0ABD2P205_9CUCU
MGVTTLSIFNEVDNKLEELGSNFQFSTISVLDAGTSASLNATDVWGTQLRSHLRSTPTSMVSPGLPARLSGFKGNSIMVRNYRIAFQYNGLRLFIQSPVVS